MGSKHPGERPRLPNVGVVIPVHNAQAWIKDTLTSVLEQTYAPELLEIIVVDDGSSDDSAAIAKSVLEAGRIDYRIMATDNGGPSRARNLGWQHTSGEWIQFLDADDLLHPQKIEIQADVVPSLPPCVAVVYSDWQRLGLDAGQWQPVGDKVSPCIGDDPVTDLLRTRNFLQVGCPLFRRTWLEQVRGFDERHWLIEDVDLMLRIAMAGGRFQRVPSDTPLMYYRQQSERTLSRRNSREFVEGCIRNAELAETYWRQNDALTPQRGRTLANVYFQGTRHFAGQDWQAFEELFERIESLGPGLLPPGPPALRLLARFLGYHQAERVAAFYRHQKRHLRRGKSLLKNNFRICE